MPEPTDKELLDRIAAAAAKRASPWWLRKLLKEREKRA